MALRFTIPSLARAIVRPSNAEALIVSPQGTLSPLATSSVSLLGRREFHSSEALERMSVKSQGIAVRQSIRQFVPEIGVVAQPNEPPSNWGSVEKWKDFVMTPWRHCRNWYIGYTIRKDGVGKLKNFAVKDFKTFVPEAYITYNKAFVKQDFNKLRDVVGAKFLDRLKADEKMKGAAKKFKLEWDGQVDSVKVHSLVLIPVEEINTTFAQASVLVRSKQQLKVLDKKSGKQVAGQTEMKQMEEWWVMERPVQRDHVEWKFISKLPADAKIE